MRNFLIHGHIFKNAGSSLDWALVRNFGDRFLDHREDKAMREQRGKHLASVLQERPDLQSLSSHHLCYPLPELDDVSFHPVYLLRHPVERIASVYAFERRQDGHSHGAIAAKKMSFPEYVAWRMRSDVPSTVRDYQTRYLAGYHDRRPRESVPVDWLRRAINHTAAIKCLGVVERYDESMVVFEHALRPAFPDIDLAYIRQNTGTTSRGNISLAQRLQQVFSDLGELLPDVLANNSFDLALYRHANQKLDEARDAIADFPDRLEDFRSRCARLRKRRFL